MDYMLSVKTWAKKTRRWRNSFEAKRRMKRILKLTTDKWSRLT